MADAMELLSGLLKNKDALNNLKNMVTDSPTDDEGKNTGISYDGEIPDLSFITDLLSSNKQNVEFMNKIKKAYDAYSDNNDPGINLLNAISPYLSGKRNANLSKIMTAVKVGKAFNRFGR